MVKHMVKIVWFGKARGWVTVMILSIILTHQCIIRICSVPFSPLMARLWTAATQGTAGPPILKILMSGFRLTS